MSFVLSAADVIDTFRAHIKATLPPGKAQKELKPEGRFTITKGHRTTRKHLSKSEVKVLKAEGWDVVLIEDRQVENYEERLIRSMSYGTSRAARGHVKRQKKFAGCLRTTPASIRTHVRVRQHKVDGSYIDHLIPRVQYYPQEAAQNVA